MRPTSDERIVMLATVALASLALGVLVLTLAAAGVLHR